MDIKQRSSKQSTLTRSLELLPPIPAMLMLNQGNQGGYGGLTFFNTYVSSPVLKFPPLDDSLAGNINQMDQTGDMSVVMLRHTYINIPT